MGKTAYTVEVSYEKRLKSFNKLMLITGIVLEILFAYVGLTVQAYLSVNPRETILSALPGALMEAVKNPLYFIPITYSVFPVLLVCVVALLMIFVMYATEVKKIHHNINTIKGSAEWQSALELTKRFAEYE